MRPPLSIHLRLRNCDAFEFALTLHDETSHARLQAYTYSHSEALSKAAVIEKLVGFCCLAKGVR